MSACNTTCPYCGVGCGVEVGSRSDGVIAVTGDRQHPANHGRLCVKGTALGETLGDAGRLLHPQLEGENVSWDQALDLVARKLHETRAEHGPDAIAFYLSGQLLTEDYYVANKLMKGFMGSANVDTNSRLCMSSAVAAYKRAFGEDIVPCTYTDLESCELLIMVGSNAAWTHPVVYQRIVAAKQQNPAKRIVVIDTRRTATCDVADLHLQIKPGSDAFLFAGLLHHVVNNNALDSDYIDRHTDGFDACIGSISGIDRTTVLRGTGLSPEQLAQFYALFLEHHKTVTLFSQGINQSASGTDKCNAIINCHLATGRIGKPGMGPFSITGQPNAMGGREVGGLSNQLAAHMDFTDTDIDRVRRFWQAPDMAQRPGLKAVDLFDAAAEGRIKFLWIMATNPAVSLPDSARVRAALQACDFVVVSDCNASTDTNALANLLLPARGWGEKSGTVTNSERVISRQRALVPPAGQARADWQIITDVAGRLGFAKHFAYRGPADVFREHAALSAFENHGQRAFDIGALQHLSDELYDTMQPLRWPATAAPASEPIANGRYYTGNGRARFVAVTPLAPPQRDELVLNTGRLRDQWHTMTRTGGVPRLARHRDYFSIYLNAGEVTSRGLREGDLARLVNAGGAVTGLIAIDDGLPAGQCFVPIHWSDRFTAQGKVSALIPSITDPVSGQPQSKFAHVHLQSVAANSWGLVFTRDEIALQGLEYWSRIRVDGGYVSLLADGGSTTAVATLLREQSGARPGNLVSYSDSEQGEIRELEFIDGEIRSALFLTRDRRALPDQKWIAALGTTTLSTPHHLLAGLDSCARDTGRTICSCREVGEHEIAAAIANGASTVSALGQALRCGTQCGSCVPELKSLLQQHRKDCAA